ncbi:MAG: secondary thiamine-phosphate synthase enzyme YjbQ [Candidatus Omnitrophica bacterium]|nr:secondary thiamine-phosphate synthase enzyme YjbQ [Candidatus Omnitrophota bacterium]
MVVTRSIKIKTKGDTDIHNITPDIKRLLRESKLTSGIVTVFVPGSTGALTTIEFEPGAVHDLKEAFERIAPRNAEYRHNGTWNDGNGFSHVRAALMGPGITIPFKGKELTLGTWQQVILIDFDNRPRSREICVQFMGEV